MADHIVSKLTKVLDKTIHKGFAKKKAEHNMTENCMYCMQNSTH